VARSLLALARLLLLRLMARRFTSTNLVIAESKPNITNSTTKNDCKSTTIENDGKIIVVLEIIAMSNVKIITNG
jgi:hypothetical protein